MNRALNALGSALLVLIVAGPFLVQCATLKAEAKKEAQCYAPTLDAIEACTRGKPSDCIQEVKDWLACMKQAGIPPTAQVQVKP